MTKIWECPENGRVILVFERRVLRLQWKWKLQSWQHFLLTLLVEKYQWEFAAMEEARQLPLKEKDQLTEELQETLEERNSLLIVVSKLEGDLEHLRTQTTQSYSCQQQ